MNYKHEQIWESLSDPEFRKQFIDEHVNVGIAFQIRSLRNRRNLKQSDLARLLNLKQPQVSSWENPNYGNYSLNTLKDLAKAFDVGLLVRFVPFSTLVDWTINLTNDVIAPPSFSEEGRYHVAASVSTVHIGEIRGLDADNNNMGFFVKPQILGTLASTANTSKEEVHA